MNSLIVYLYCANMPDRHVWVKFSVLKYPKKLDSFFLKREPISLKLVGIFIDLFNVQGEIYPLCQTLKIDL